MGFFVAWQFLTAIPLPLRREVSAGELGRSQVYFSLVGLVLGLVVAALDWLLGRVFPAAVVNALIIITLVIATGALHLDGFIDTCDGVVGGGLPERRLAIMRDARIGSFGAVGVCCLLLLKYASLTALAGVTRTVALILAPVLSRWAMVYALFAYPYARVEGGKGTAFHEEARWWRLALATVVALACSALLLGPAGLALLLGAWLVTVALSSYIRARLGGLTGDSYGAVNEVIEVAVLALAPLALPLLQAGKGWLPAIGGWPFV